MPSTEILSKSDEMQGMEVDRQQAKIYGKSKNLPGVV
jgi:hypothetical protein